MKLIVKNEVTPNNFSDMFNNDTDGDCFQVTDKDGDVIVLMKTDQCKYLCIATSDGDEYDTGVTWTWGELIDHLTDWGCDVKKLPNPVLYTEV